MQALTGIWKLKNWTDLSKKKTIIASIIVRMWPVHPKTKEFTQTTPAENEKKNSCPLFVFLHGLPQTDIGTGENSCQES